MNPNGDRDKTFRVSLSDEESVDIRIHIPAIRAQGLDLTPWASTHVLANLVHKLDIKPSQLDSSALPILELGAGIGLVGLVAAMVWHRLAVLTDLKPIVTGLTMNINLNSDLLASNKGSACAGELDWDKPEALILEDGSLLDPTYDKARIIFAADTIYSDDHPEMVTQTILKWLAPGPLSRAVLTYPLRVAYLDQIRELWSLMEQSGLVCVQEGKEEAAEMIGDSWDDETLCEWSVWKWKDGS